MAYFEQNPWLLIVLIILTVEAWTTGKKLVQRALFELSRRIPSSNRATNASFKFRRPTDS